jgi:Fe2+ transport system protein FeoA
MQNTSLDRLKPGHNGKIVSLKAQGKLRTRLLDMGLVTGSEVTMIRKAPLGDPLEIEVKGYSLSLRKSEAELITLELAK